MIASAVTISLVPEARGGPFVFWDDLGTACTKAAELGFDAVELFAPSAEAVGANELHRLLDQYQLKLAAVGTGAGMVVRGLSLTDPDPERRAQARGFVRSMIDFGGPLHAPAIIGSMQGRWGGAVTRDQARAWLSDALNEFGGHARQYDVPLIYEPLNRYETNLINTIAQGVGFVSSLESDNVKLLADLFHMNIEETDIAAAILTGRGHIGHVHFVDSNRRPAGNGHIDYSPIAAALREIQYQGYLSAEALPYPSSDEAAQQTIRAFHQYFQNAG